MPGSGVFSKRIEYPYFIKSPTDLPAGLRKLAEQSLLPDDPPHTIFVVPPQSIPGLTTASEQALLFTAQGVLHIQGAKPPKHPAQAVYLRGDRLLFTQLSMILLYERLELCGIAESALTRIVVEYNAVSHDLVQPAIQRLLRLSWGLSNFDKSRVDTTRLFLYNLEQMSYKFSSGLRIHALQKDEQLLGFVFQPRIMKRYLGVIRRQVTPPTLLALTQNELIVIEEGMTSAARYAWFITHCPRICITGVEINPSAMWQEVCVYLSRDNLTVERRAKLGNDAAQDWQTLWSSQQ